MCYRQLKICCGGGINLYGQKEVTGANIYIYIYMLPYGRATIYGINISNTNIQNWDVFII